MYPPQLHSDDYEELVPLDAVINTAGAEDSAFILPDGNTLYVWFTPDPDVPVEKQLLDGVTGIYVSHKQNGHWGEAERVFLQDPDELSLDGCLCVVEDILWFCTARKGNYRGVDMWTAEFEDGRWANWENAGEKLNVDYGVGELHVTADGNEIYYHSDRPGSKGGYDIWVTRKVNGEWQKPENIEELNTVDTEGWPFVSQDGRELWFTRWYMGYPAVFRSIKTDVGWSEAELIISQFAAEPSLDDAGNLYFAHHFIEDGKMLDADIYVAYRK